MKFAEIKLVAVEIARVVISDAKVFLDDVDAWLDKNGESNERKDSSPR